MGFSSGSSAAKREAKKAEARYYNEYFTAVKQTGQLKTIDSMDVDGVATVPKRYNEAVSKYNKRLSDLDRQMRGEVLTERVQEAQNSIRSGLIEKIKQSDSRSSVLGGAPNLANFGQSSGNLGGIVGANLPKQDNSPEARADRILKGTTGQTGWAAIGNAAYYKEVQDYTMASKKYGAVTGSYRDNMANKAAFDELNALSAEVNEARKADKIDKFYNDPSNQLGTPQGDVLASQKRKAKSGQGFRSTILAGGQAGAEQAARRTVLGGA